MNNTKTTVEWQELVDELKAWKPIQDGIHAKGPHNHDGCGPSLDLALDDAGVLVQYPRIFDRDAVFGFFVGAGVVYVDDARFSVVSEGGVLITIEADGGGQVEFGRPSQYLAGQIMTGLAGLAARLEWDDEARSDGSGTGIKTLYWWPPEAIAYGLFNWRSAWNAVSGPMGSFLSLPTGEEE